MRDDLTPSGALPDPFDRQLGALHDLPDVTRTKESTVRVVPTLGIGGAQMFVVQTYRQRDRGDTVFLEAVGAAGVVRLVIPPAVADVIARQRDTLTAKSRSRAAKARAAADRAAGRVPGFARRKESTTGGALFMPPRKRGGGK